MASTSCRMMDLVSGSLRAPRLSSTRCSVGPLQTSMTRCTTPAVTGVRSWCRAGAVSRAGAAVQRPVQSSGACAERACCAGCRRERARLSGVWFHGRGQSAPLGSTKASSMLVMPWICEIRAARSNSRWMSSLICAVIPELAPAHNAGTLTNFRAASFGPSPLSPTTRHTVPYAPFPIGAPWRSQRAATSLGSALLWIGGRGPSPASIAAERCGSMGDLATSGQAAASPTARGLGLLVLWPVCWTR